MRLPFSQISMCKALRNPEDLLKWRKADKLHHLPELRKVLQHVSAVIKDGCHGKYLHRVLHLL